MTATALVLRTCTFDMMSYRGSFTWPASGHVSAPDWDPIAECGHGLHGLLWGEGDGELLSWDPSARWLVVEVDLAEIVDLGGKVKFPCGDVVACGTRGEATAYLLAHGGAGRVVVGADSHAGDGGTATAGHRGTATAGHGGTATAGYRGTATAGARGTATAGNDGTATAGYGGRATAGYRGTATAGLYATTGYGGTATAGARGTATAGPYGTAFAGAGGTATAGPYGTAFAGDGGTATAGPYGTASAGDGGTAAAGDGGKVILRWYDVAQRRSRLAVGYVGEGGIEAGVAYRCDENGKIVEAT